MASPFITGYHLPGKRNYNLVKRESRTVIFGARGLGNILTGLLKPMADKHSGFLSRIIADWRLIAGEEIASRARPVRGIYPKKGEAALCLEVKEGFILELQYMETLLLEKIAVYFGYKPVVKLRYIQAEPKTSKPRRLPTKNIAAADKAILIET